MLITGERGGGRERGNATLTVQKRVRLILGGKENGRKGEIGRILFPTMQGGPYNWVSLDNTT